MNNQSLKDIFIEDNNTKIIKAIVLKPKIEENELFFYIRDKNNE